MPRRKRLTRSEVMEIYRSDDNKIDIQKEYNIARDCLNKIKAGMSYKHITGGGNKNYRDKSHIKPKREELYRGFSIVTINANSNNGFSEYCTILNGGRRMTQMYLSSIKACKNVIDTYCRANPPIYTPSTELTVQSVNQ